MRSVSLTQSKSPAVAPFLRLADTLPEPDRSLFIEELRRLLARDTLATVLGCVR